MKDWQLSVVAEHAELDERLESWDVFLGGSPLVSDGAGLLLSAQRAAMVAYRDILAERIAAFSSPCVHPDDQVVADILEGDVAGWQVQWCRQCGAVRVGIEIERPYVAALQPWRRYGDWREVQPGIEVGRSATDEVETD